jgi:hemolysin activation/secretion protein
VIRLSRSPRASLCLAALAIGLSQAPVSRAQGIPGSTTSANPAVATQRSFDADIAERKRRFESQGPQGVSPVAPVPAPDKPRKGSQGPRFEVRKIHLEGVTAIPTTKFAQLLTSVEGRSITLGQLREFTAKIETLYRARGYFLARALIPRQDVSNGHVRIVVSEGRYGKTKISGNRHYSNRFIERFFESARHTGLIRQRPLERALLLLNEFPDLSVHSLFVTGTEPGTADVVLNVKDRTPVHVTLDYNNYGIPSVGEHRTGQAISAGNALMMGDDLYVRVVEQFPSKSDPLYQANYSAPVGDRGNRLGFQYLNSATRVTGANLDILDIRGSSEIFGLSLAVPLDRTPQHSSNLNGGVLVKTVKNFFFGDTLTNQDDLRLLTFGWNESSLGERRRTGHSETITQGLGTAFGGSPNGGPLASRADAGNFFTKFNSDSYAVLDVSRHRSLLIRASVQLSTEPLPVAELFAIGGPDSVRGFLQSESLGDQGYQISFEHRWALVTERRFQLQTAAFIDRGETSVLNPQVREPASRRLVGAGFGLRGSIGRTTTFKLDLGFPTSVDRNAQGDSSVVYAQLVARY